MYSKPILAKIPVLLKFPLGICLVGQLVFFPLCSSSNIKRTGFKFVLKQHSMIRPRLHRVSTLPKVYPMLEIGDKIHSPCSVQKYIRSARANIRLHAVSQIQWASSKVTVFSEKSSLFMLLFFLCSSARKCCPGKTENFALKRRTLKNTHLICPTLITSHSPEAELQHAFMHSTRTVDLVLHLLLWICFREGTSSWLVWTGGAIEA